MGFFSEIRKLLFVKKSVAKSGADKVKEESMEALDELAEMGREIKHRTEEKIDNLVEAFTGDDVDASSPDEIISSTETTPTTSEESLASSGNENDPAGTELPDGPSEKTFVEKIGEKTISGMEELGDNVLKGAEKAGEKLGDVAEKVGKKVNEGASELVEKAKQAAEFIDKKLDETVERAKELDEELGKNDQDKDGYADSPIDLGDSTLKDSGDFFEKAKRFAEGKPLDESKPDITIPNEKVSGPKYEAYGFEDGDGDGNELIDDAIIEEE